MREKGRSVTFMNEFEKKLKELFPEVYTLYELTKHESQGGGGEENLWNLLEVLTMLNKSKSSGTVFVNYINGKIGSLSVKTDYRLNGIPKQSIDKSGQ